MRNRLLLLVSLLALSVGCSRDPIFDEVSKYRVDFDIRDNALWCRKASPELIQVMFYDPASGKKVYETYLSPEGGYLYSITPGRYNIVAFAMGDGATDIEYSRDFNLLSARTKTIQTKPETVINAPDHLLVGTLTPVDIPYLSEADPLFRMTIPMSSICDSWKVVVKGVKGLEYTSSVSMYVYNQKAEVPIRTMQAEGSSALSTKGAPNLSEGTLEIPFCTFGMNDGGISVRISIESLDRQVHTAVFDVTDQVTDTSNDNHVITVEFPVELLPPIQGGLDPSADEWDDHHEFIDVT